MSPHSKDFEAWHKRKSEINRRSDPPYFYEKEIWWVALGHNVGFEEDGKNEQFSRPVLVLRKFNKNIFWGVPLSSTEKEGPYYYRFQHDGRSSTALLSQLRLFDSSRLLDKFGYISEEILDEIKKKTIKIIVQMPQK